MKISVVNLSNVSAGQIHTVLRAVNCQIEQDFAPYWHLHGQVRLDAALGEMGDATRPHDAMRGDAIIYLLETVQPEALAGYHERHNLGIPYGVVHIEVATKLEHNDTKAWSITLSHEALELLADPHVNLLCRGPHPNPNENGRVVFHWLEMCDAVQSESYEIDGVRVSNFVLPSYFTDLSDARGHHDFLSIKDDNPLRPFGVKKGGYVGFFDPERGADDHYMLPGDDEAGRRAQIRAATSPVRRRDRRGRTPVQTSASPSQGGRAPRSMSTELQQLYVQLGDPPQSSVPKAVRGMVDAGVATAPVATLHGASLLPEEVPELRALLETNPDGVKEFFAIARGRPVTTDEAHAILDALSNDLSRPTERIKHLALFGSRTPTHPPADFTFEGYAPDEIPIDTGDTSFQTRADAFRYLVRGGVNAALYHTGRLKVAPLRSHESVESRFIYLLDRAPIDEALSIALCADIGNGLSHARYITRRIASKPYLYAAHLGDVYYAGSDRETDEFLRKPFSDALDAGTELFLLEGNHEMYAKGEPFLRYLEGKQNHPGGVQRQEGTYFRLKRNCPVQADGTTRGFQIIGADTAWYKHARYERPELRRWLRDSLVQGRDEGRMNILLTSNDPYEYTKADTTKLYGDLREFVEQEHLVDLWFWGNTHYCALFEPGPFSFIGSCIGHAGYPYERQFVGEVSPAPCRWVEDGNRFGRDDIRPDRGNNGFCELTLMTNGHAHLRYIDWMGRLRHTATVTLTANGPRLT